MSNTWLPYLPKFHYEKNCTTTNYHDRKIWISKIVSRANVYGALKIQKFELDYIVWQSDDADN